MLMELLSGGMTVANLVNLAVLRSAFDALMRTVQCVDDGELRKQCGTQFSDQVRKRTPSSDVYMYMCVRVLATHKNGSRECHMYT